VLDLFPFFFPVAAARGLSKTPAARLTLTGHGDVERVLSTTIVAQGKFNREGRMAPVRPPPSVVRRSACHIVPPKRLLVLGSVALRHETVVNLPTSRCYCHRPIFSADGFSEKYAPSSDRDIIRDNVCKIETITFSIPLELANWRRTRDKR